MSAAVSRRRFGQLAAGASLVALSAIEPAVAKGSKPVFTKEESGISYYDIKTGSGASPIEGDFVIVDYLAFLSTGKIFDNRKGFVFQMGRRQIIPGLEEAISTMKPGGERRVVVPPKLAYGDKGVCLEKEGDCLVPPGETLGYSVTLQRVAVPPT
ncbi:FK506-binding protein 4 [Gracilariopsis chorda]|uniref:peptidylprolyl isomerase n=1 Tax=Gracilariopsis chorda TaxID=448386 RepID=A0A2V3IFP5_9FLOR|nr:FK506-binding protein 4 [Gracilariopsis chorda]|eukprot:PXF40897.1 FK506-binding protein 4 [Gracilariopsis chorda]